MFCHNTPSFSSILAISANFALQMWKKRQILKFLKEKKVPFRLCFGIFPLLIFPTVYDYLGNFLFFWKKGHGEKEITKGENDFETFYKRCSCGFHYYFWMASKNNNDYEFVTLN